MKEKKNKDSLAEECEKLDQEYERGLAEEMLTGEHFEVSLYFGKVSK